MKDTLLNKIFKPKLSYNKVTSKILDRYNYSINNTISKYKMALVQAKNGNRIELIKLSIEALRDNHLNGIINLRKEKVLSTPFTIRDKTNEPYKDSYKFNSKWFYTFLSMLLNENYFGYSLVQIDEIKNDTITKISQVPFINVHIEDATIIPDIYNPYERISYLKPNYYKWLLEAVDERTNLGILSDIIPLTMWKRSAMSAWAEYTEVFGMPIRIGKTSSINETDRQRLGEFLKGLAKSAWAVIDEQEQIEFIESSNTDAFNVYDKFIETINNEMSKRIIGGSDIVDSHSGSGYAQSTTQGSQFDAKIKADLRNAEFYINDVLFPKLVYFGIIPEGLVFHFDNFEQLSLLDQINIDKELNIIKPLDKDYLSNKYRVKFDESME